MRHLSQHNPRDSGFTVLELMMAITVFSLVSVAVFMVFKTGTETYAFSSRDAQTLQRARYVFDTVERDIRHIFYRPEDSYNRELQEEITAFQEALERVEVGELEPREFEEMYGEEGVKENPFERGRLIDLQMFGEDGGERDSLTFATQIPLREGEPYSMWGIARVHYSVDGDFLIRSRESVEAQPRTWTGEIDRSRAQEPTHTIVSRGVKKFDLSFGFWNDHQWFEAPFWSSNTRTFRSSGNILGEYEFDEDEENPLGQTGNNINPAQQQIPFDGLPTWVRLDVAIADPENDARLMHMSRIFRVPGSMETWVENQTLDEDQRDNEIRLREDEWIPVEPGGLQ